MRTQLILAAAALAFAGCDSNLVAPIAGDRLEGPPNNPNVITVMTRNIDEGANLDPILLATDPNQVPIAVGQIFAEMNANNFPERAGALAREIAQTRPQLVGLQEVALWRVQTGPNPFAPATAVAFDYLDILLGCSCRIRGRLTRAGHLDWCARTSSARRRRSGRCRVSGRRTTLAWSRACCCRQWAGRSRNAA